MDLLYILAVVIYVRLRGMATSEREPHIRYGRLIGRECFGYSRMKKRIGGNLEDFRWLCPLLVLFVIAVCFLQSTHSKNQVATDVDPYQTALREYKELNVSSLPPLTIWSSDFHISPIADLKFLLKDFNVRFIDKSLSSHCSLSNTCASDLKVITQANGIRLNPCPNGLRREFYETYRNDPEFMSADAIVCTHAISMCELFMPFGKPLILLASTRYEIGRHDRVDWERWNSNLHHIASKPYNFIAANNKYDAEYMKYFTSLVDVPVLPSYCEYVNTVYRPQLNKPFLLAPSRGVNRAVSSQLRSSLKSFNEKQESSITITAIRDLYPRHFEYSDLATHPAIVLLPYQVSVMSLFEFYRMAIPLFVPSLNLLTQWHLKYRILSERTWDSVYGHPERRSAIEKHTNSTCSMQYDPNNEFEEDALKEWLALSDFYQWPHIHVFQSFEDLFLQLQRSDFLSISQDMRRYNLEVKIRLKKTWKGILENIHVTKELRRLRKELPLDVNDALMAEYGVCLRENDCTRQEEA